MSTEVFVADLIESLITHSIRMEHFRTQIGINLRVFGSFAATCYFEFHRKSSDYQVGTSYQR